MLPTEIENFSKIALGDYPAKCHELKEGLFYVTNFCDGVNKFHENEDLLIVNGPFLSLRLSNLRTSVEVSNILHYERLLSNGLLNSESFYSNIKEISILLQFLNQDFLKVLISTNDINLETLKIEGYPEIKSAPIIPVDTWKTFSLHFPNLNLIALFYLSEKENYSNLIATHVPFTHLYFGSNTPASIISEVDDRCPKLKELVIGEFGPNNLDKVLLAVAKKCPQLMAIGIEDCQITCCGLISFVEECCERLQFLHIWDTSIIDIVNNDFKTLSNTISSLLKRPWEPFYVPQW